MGDYKTCHSGALLLHRIDYPMSQLNSFVILLIPPTINVNISRKLYENEN